MGTLILLQKLNLIKTNDMMHSCGVRHERGAKRDVESKLYSVNRTNYTKE